MDKITAIDNLIAAAIKPIHIAEYTAASMEEIEQAEKEYVDEKKRVLDSIQAFCDCGKGDMCPEFGREFIRQQTIADIRVALALWRADPWNPIYGKAGFNGVLDAVANRKI